jgi:hypothetical protein
MITYVYILLGRHGDAHKRPIPHHALHLGGNILENVPSANVKPVLTYGSAAWHVPPPRLRAEGQGRCAASGLLGTLEVGQDSGKTVRGHKTQPLPQCWKLRPSPHH